MAQEPEITPAPSKKGGLMKIIILAVIVVLLAAGGFVGYKFVYPKFFKKSDNATEAKTEEKAPAKDEKGDKKDKEKTDKNEQSKVDAKSANGTLPGAGSELVQMPTFLVNLSDPAGKRYLKLTLEAQLIDKAATADFSKNMSIMRDAILLLLSSKSYAELASIEDKIQLKKEIVSRLNQIMGGPKIVDVYFTDFIIQ